MILGPVKGTVYSTRKMEQLVGYKFLLVEPMYGSKKELIVAGDRLGAGIGELVMVTTDETVQHGLDAPAPMAEPADPEEPEATEEDFDPDL